MPTLDVPSQQNPRYATRILGRSTTATRTLGRSASTVSIRPCWPGAPVVVPPVPPAPLSRQGGASPSTGPLRQGPGPRHGVPGGVSQVRGAIVLGQLWLS